jgi:UDP-GlcNAc3NAcA epimerase
MSRPDGSMTLALCFGTRPQVIKAGGLLRVLRARWKVTTVDTGQHYDFELNQLLYQQLDLVRPDFFLDVGSADPASQTAAVLTGTAQVLRHTRPDAVVVIGDTNSTLGCALAASKEGMPLVHVEAGLRSTESNLPEEANRRVVDVLGNLLCAPSATSAARLAAEQVPGVVVTTGDVARDVLCRHLRLAPPAKPRPVYALATVHRAAVTEDREALHSVIRGLGQLGVPVVFPVHPRTRRAMERFNLLPQIPASIQLCPPLGYLEAIAAVRDAAVVVTDSGGLQREAYWLGRPCVSLRRETEWVETLECGANALVPPLEAGDSLRRVVITQRQWQRDQPWSADAYGDGHAAERIADAIEVHLFGRESIQARST